MPKIPEIRTRRLLLRGLRPSDADAIVRNMSDWDTVRMLARPPHPYTMDDAQAWLTKAVDYPWEYAIDRDGLIGVVGVTGHLGYWLARPHWGQGFLTEAASALLDTYFTHAGSKKIISGAFADNPGSQAVLAKLGFTRTGRSRQFVPSRGAEVDHIDMALTRADWRARTMATVDADAPGRD